MIVRFMKVWGAINPKDVKYCCTLHKGGEVVAAGYSSLRDLALQDARREYLFNTNRLF